MDVHHPADDIIRGAIDAGVLDTSAHAGKPLPPMRQNNPGWWIQSFLAREKLPEQMKETSERADIMLAQAVGADSLGEARSILADRNTGIEAWNRVVPEEHQLDLVEETDLLTMRSQMQKSHPTA